MHTLHVDVPVGRRTVLSPLYDEQGELLRVEKTIRATMVWARANEIKKLCLVVDGQTWLAVIDDSLDPAPMPVHP